MLERMENKVWYKLKFKYQKSGKVKKLNSKSLKLMEAFLNILKVLTEKFLIKKSDFFILQARLQFLFKIIKNLS